ncbi:MAG TPA: ABC transporter substrate-binding protein, partial [Micromonosporaceae bacterium]
MRRILYVMPPWWDSLFVEGQSAAGEHNGALSGPEVVPDQDSRFRAFMFADIRGFTRFTDLRGAEAAADLTSRFVVLASEVASSYRGVVTGTWGDQVLVEFSSARDAVRAAVELQRRCRAATVARPAAPLGVGIGVDVGEPAGEQDLLAGNALNVAARLCAAAAAGEVLASTELLHLAGNVDGVVREPRGRLRLKGITRPVPVIRLLPADHDEHERAFRAALIDREARRRRRHRLWFVAAFVAVALVAGGVAWELTRGDVAAREISIPAQALGAVDVTDGRLVGTVRLGASPEAVAASSDGRDIWVANPADDSVVRIDARSRHQVQKVPVGNGPVALVAVGPNVWVVNSLDATVTEISSRTNAPVGDPIKVGTYPSAIAYGLGWLWITNEGDGTLTRLDPTGARPPRVVNVGTAPDGVAVGAGAVWVANRNDNTVSPVDPSRMQSESPVRVGAGPRAVVVAAGRVWVADSLEQSIAAIDPYLRSARLVGVGDVPTALAAGAGAVWASDAGSATLSRIDGKTGDVTSRYVGGSPRGLAMIGSTLWIASQPFASRAHRGGTLVEASPFNNPDTIDPAANYNNWPLLHLVYDGLVAWNREPGGAGYELVPDLAITLPVPTADRRTYTFTLRTGIRYSNGTPVRASDVRRGIERQFMPFVRRLNHPGYYDGIVGAAACVKEPQQCDLTSGIVTNDATGTITFHLIAPDPDFVGKLAVIEWAAAVPPGTPL